MNVVGDFGKTRCLAACTLALLICAGLWAPRASADDRKFTVMLAVPGKSVPGGAGTLNLPNASTIWDHYFDRTKNGPDGIDSFAEYWYEISYGTVSVTGDTLGWVEVPWPVLPMTLLPDPNQPLDPNALRGYILPFRDLDASGLCEQFEGEPVNQFQAKIMIDYNGNGGGTGFEGNVGPFSSTGNDSYPLGFEDYDLRNRPVWTPGERFRDLNGNGRYDALLEPSRDGWATSVSNCCTIHQNGGCDLDDCELKVQKRYDPNDPNHPTSSDPNDATTVHCFDHKDPVDPNQTITGNWDWVCVQKAQKVCNSPGNPNYFICSDACTKDGLISATEFCDWDGDSQWDFPEPFEDFLVIYNANGATPDDRWVKLDPSYKNDNAANRAWAEAYIRANYPGDVGEPLRYKGDPNARGFMARFGNDKYDPPDDWTESGSQGKPNAGSKLQQAPAASAWVNTAITPAPDTGVYPWSYKTWW